MHAVVNMQDRVGQPCFQPKTLAVLLPASSRGCHGHNALTTYADQLCTSIRRLVGGHGAIRVVCGMDDCDPARSLVYNMCRKLLTDKVMTLRVFSASSLTDARNSAFDSWSNGCTAQGSIGQQAAPICWMWGELARVAVRCHKAELLLLLGDDTEIQPDAWVHLIRGWHIVTANICMLEDCFQMSVLCRHSSLHVHCLCMVAKGARQQL